MMHTVDKWLINAQTKMIKAKEGRSLRPSFYFSFVLRQKIILKNLRIIVGGLIQQILIIYLALKVYARYIKSC